MRKLWLCLKTLWLIGTCGHMNMGRCIVWDDTTELTVCKHCGLVMQIVLAEQDKGKYTKVAMCHRVPFRGIPQL